MIGSPKFAIVSSYFCLLVGQSSIVHAQDRTQPPAAKRSSATRPDASSVGANRPSAELLESSLGWTAILLAAGGAMLLATRHLRKSIGGDMLTPEELPRVASRVVLAPRQAIHVVRIGGRVLLIGTGPQGAPTLLSEWISEIPPNEFQDGTSSGPLDAKSVTWVPESDDEEIAA